MKKKLMTVAVSGGLALAIGLPAATVRAECEGVEIQSRLALANCMIESAVGIAAAMVQYQGCNAGEWDIRALVDEYYLQTLPIQGSLSVTGDGETFLLNGKSAAQFNPELNNVLCQVSSEDIANMFAGVPFTYSGGRDNYYPDAVIDRQSALICVTDYLGSGRVTLDVPGNPQYLERDTLAFSTDGTTIYGDGALTVLRRGQGGSVATWGLAKEILMPPIDTLQTDGFEVEATLNGCEIEIEADVYNGGVFVPEFGYGLDIYGTLKIEPEE